MPTIRVTLKHTDTNGKMITKRYPHAQARVNSATNVLQVYRSPNQPKEHEEILAEFHPETYLCWE